jgi:nucleoside-diphosphate-sugar epimerase
MEKVLVTGATGFVGGALVDKLLMSKWQVTALVRTGSSIKALGRKKIKLIVGDLRDRHSLDDAVKGADIVFNCAAALPHHNLPDRKYWEVNVTGVENLMNVCQKNKVRRVVHISTVGIYGITSRRGVSERAKPNLSDVYSKTKLEGERIIWKYIKNGLSATIIRPTIAYGPGDTRPGFLNLFLLIKKGIFVPVGKGNNFFHTIYIENLLDALMLAARRKVAKGEDFIIGDDPCPRMKEIVQTMANLQSKKLPSFYLPTAVAYIVGTFFDLFKNIGLTVPLTKRRVNFMTENKRFKIDKAQRVLGYEPKVGLEKGLQKTLEWYKERKYL